MKRQIPLFILTLFALLVSGCEVFPYVMPSTPEPPEVFEEATALPTDRPPTATLIPSPTPTQTLEEISESTPEPALEEPAEPTLILDPVYTLQEGSPAALPNFNHPEDGCEWLGVAGQVFDEEGLEVIGLTVLVGDSNKPNDAPLEGITGDVLAYGLGGYEIQMAAEALESSERYWIQVLNPDGTPLTIRHSFNTYQDCEQNLILINFVPLDESAVKDALTPTPTIPAYP